MPKIILKSEAVIGAYCGRVESSKGITDAYLKLFLPHDSDVDAFRGMSDDDFRGGKRTGGRLVRIVIEEYDDDCQDTPPEYEDTKPPKLSQIAAIIGQDPMFPDFCREFYGLAIKQMRAEDIWPKDSVDERKVQIERGAALIRYVCSIDSRSKLDSDPHAIQQFNMGFNGPFNDWKRKFK